MYLIFYLILGIGLFFLYNKNSKNMVLNFWLKEGREINKRKEQWNGKKKQVIQNKIE